MVPTQKTSPPNKGEVSFPALGNALGYFIVLYLVANTPWLGEEDQTEAVAFMGTICIHGLQVIRWAIQRAALEIKTRRESKGWIDVPSDVVVDSIEGDVDRGDSPISTSVPVEDTSAEGPEGQGPDESPDP